MLEVAELAIPPHGAHAGPRTVGTDADAAVVAGDIVELAEVLLRLAQVALEAGGTAADGGGERLLLAQTT